MTITNHSCEHNFTAFHKVSVSAAHGSQEFIMNQQAFCVNGTLDFLHKLPSAVKKHLLRITKRYRDFMGPFKRQRLEQCEEKFNILEAIVLKRLTVANESPFYGIYTQDEIMDRERIKERYFKFESLDNIDFYPSSDAIPNDAFLDTMVKNLLHSAVDKLKGNLKKSRELLKNEECRPQLIEKVDCGVESHLTHLKDVAKALSPKVKHVFDVIPLENRNKFSKFVHDQRVEALSEISLRSVRDDLSTCPNCSNVLPNASMKWVSCEGCFQWFHQTCIDKTKNPITNSYWLCPQCKELIERMRQTVASESRESISQEDPLIPLAVPQALPESTISLNELEEENDLGKNIMEEDEEDDTEEEEEEEEEKHKEQDHQKHHQESHQEHYQEQLKQDSQENDEDSSVVEGEEDDVNSNSSEEPPRKRQRTQPNGWQCPDCTFFNNDEILCCKVCKRARDSSDDELLANTSDENDLKELIKDKSFVQINVLFECFSYLKERYGISYMDVNYFHGDISSPIENILTFKDPIPLQLIYDDTRHYWIALWDSSREELLVVDSHKSDTATTISHRYMQHVLALLFGKFSTTNTLTIRFVHCAQQNGDGDCGVFAFIFGEILSRCLFEKKPIPDLTKIKITRKVLKQTRQRMSEIISTKSYKEPTDIKWNPGKLRLNPVPFEINLLECCGCASTQFPSELDGSDQFPFQTNIQRYITDETRCNECKGRNWILE
eukprot:TRINITY_DN42_c1_g1_i10.p1 TRINITY_DN42_c1_g1~~TRINITY_DN42_c1_g1_i10.p1  ORF type:complete len:722 (+),score=182.65 TRINITY_DN42_c1_g1_i10:3466-5631(+)